MNEIRIYKIVMVAALLGVASMSLGAGDTWTQKADMPKARFNLSASVVDGKIYAIGGASTMHGAGLSIVDEYDPTTDTWTTKASLPTPRQYLSTSVVNGKIYAIGGDARPGAPSLSTVEMYDPATDTWTEKAPMLIPKFAHSTSVVDGKIYAIGGWKRPPTSYLLLVDVEEYDPATDTWTKKAPMPTARAALSTSVVDGKIYAIGGTTYRAGLSTVEVYDPATDTWTKKAPMPTARTTFSSTSVVDGIIYVIGGVSNEPAFSTVEAYDPATDTWTEKAPMSMVRGFLATSAVNGKIYAIGGIPSGHGAPMSTVEEYDLYPLVVDFNGDGIVDSADMCIMVDHWGTDKPLCDIGPMPWGDGIVDVEDLKVLAEHLFEEVDEPVLVAHWALDEAEGTIAYDSAGTCDGRLLGNPLWQPAGGMVNGALQFDGVDDFIFISSILNSIEGPFSVFAWIKGGGPGQVVIAQTDRVNWLCADSLEGNLMTELKGTGQSVAILPSQVAITDGNWHRIGFVWDGSYRTLYVEDVVVAEDAQDNLQVSENRLYIGTGKDREAGTYWSGLIDDVRIYNRAVYP